LHLSVKLVLDSDVQFPAQSDPAIMPQKRNWVVAQTRKEAAIEESVWDGAMA